MILFAALSLCERCLDSRASFDWRRSDAAGVIEHKPKPRIQFALLPGLGDLYQTA
jgi:hypothetical protein